MRGAIVVAGLGFGDEGKGTTVDWLVRRHESALVVRYNGGAQAAHNVVLPDGRHHTFSQFGSGTLAGADTFLSRYMLVNPSAMLNEADGLSRLGVADPLSRVHVDEDALITTPFHIAANRAREQARGDGRHGSCGMGIRETMADAEDPDRIALRVHDLFIPGALRRKLFVIQGQKQRDALVVGPLDERTLVGRVLIEPGQVDDIAARMEAWTRGVDVVGSEWLTHRLRESGPPVIFEGAQGVLLDPVYGYFPHVTATACTYRNALDLLTDHGGQVTRLAVTRTYQTRHGAGPMPSEDPALQHLLTDDHNTEGQWQGALRAGHLDLRAADRASSALGQIDGLVVTHADKLDPQALPVFTGSWNEVGRISIDDFAERIGTQVAVVSSGPTHLNKTER